MTKPNATTKPYVNDKYSIGALMGNSTFPRTTKRIMFLHELFDDTFGYVAAQQPVIAWATTDEFQDSHLSLDAMLEATKQDLIDFHVTLLPSLNAEGKKQTWYDELGDINGGEFTFYTRTDRSLLVDIDAIELGLMRFWELCLGERDKLGLPDTHEDCDTSQIGPGNIVPDNHYWRQMLVADLTNGDQGDYDCEVLNTIIELALFNQIYYG